MTPTDQMVEAGKLAVRDEYGSRLCKWIDNETKRVCRVEVGLPCMCEAIASACLTAALATEVAGEPEPVAYAVYVIGGGKTHLHEIKLIKDDEWRHDDCSLGDYWSGNRPLYAAPPKPAAVPTVEQFTHLIEQNCYPAGAGEDCYVSGIEQAAHAILALLTNPQVKA